jgi:hypothetical protein
MKPIPPRPPGWNKTLSALDDELKRGERKLVGQPEITWAVDYEREQLPAGIRFPRKGDVYEVVVEMPVHFLTMWKAPFTGSGQGLLRRGDRLLVDHDPGEPNPIGVNLIAVDYAAIEQRLVSASDRAKPNYNGFYFHFKTVVLNQQFRLVSAQ